MTKSEALKLFRENDIVPKLKLKRLNAYWCAYDRLARQTVLREAWNNFTDSLCKNRQITVKQYDTWSNPF